MRGLALRKSFMPRSRKRASDFTRGRKMAFADMILFMLGMARESARNALERAFPRLGKGARP